jgi:hypothetical protein
MLRLVADENVNQFIVRGLLLRNRGIDIVTAREVGLIKTPDPEILAWAAEHGRIVLTHDQRTMAAHAHARVARGELMPGIIIAAQALSIAAVIEDLNLMHECGDMQEWSGLVTFLPLR